MKGSDLFEREEKVIATNRKARHEFEIVQRIEAGIILTGTEVKSLRGGKCSLQDAYAGFKSSDDKELWLYQMHINPYDFGNRENHEPKRVRKLLVSQREATKLKTQVQEKGITLIPLSLYFSGHLVKVEIGLCRAKKQYDKRQTVKEREANIEMKRKLKF